MSGDSSPPFPRAAIWAGLAERLLEQALQDARDGADAIAPAEAAVAALWAQAGDIPEDEAGDLSRDLAGMLDGFVEVSCSCPPDLVARGGYRSTCLGHRGDGRG
ncbi:hypothetical protein [Thermomonospora umbrina]|uniref:hypothetical protein n=1 Tax=Thermomonospora umbrina TaxID=111806 RepID=UPI000E27AF20|nr:hypothetical protein [Thermomonospora umbrina]